MSASQSHLDDYGYDVAVAVTQDGINDAIVSCFHRTQPVITKCWTLDDDNNTDEIGYDELKKQTGIDPFALDPEQDLTKNVDKPKLDTLAKGWTIPETGKARWFHMGFQAQMGKPPGMKDDDVPDIVTLGSDLSKLRYQLFCQRFVVVSLDVGPHKYNWESWSQPPKNPWIFSCNVNLALKTTAGDLTPDVQKRVNALPPDAFSIQQLLFELGADTTFITPEIKDNEGRPLNKSSHLYVKLQETFINLYFDQAKKAGSPILRLTAYADAQQAKAAPSPLQSMGFSLSPSPDPTDPGLTTLNYLALMDNTAKLPTVKPFDWTWVESGQTGIFALRRGHVAKWLADTLHGYVQSNCWRAHNLHADYVEGSIGYGCWISNPDLNNIKNVTWNPPHSDAGVETYNSNLPAAGPTLATWEWKSDRRVYAGHGSTSSLTTNCHFNMSVSADNNALIVDETLLIYVWIQHYSLNWGDGNVIDRRLIRRYQLDAAADGTLFVSPGVDQDGGHDFSFDPSTKWASVWNGMKGSLTKMWKAIHTKTELAIERPPLTALQQNIFPGGKAFVFENPKFSAKQDLLAQVAYRDQS